MVKTFLISYDLDRPDQNYSKLISRLVLMGAVKVLMSQWVLRSSLGAVELRETLKTDIGPADRLLIIEVGNWASYNVLNSDKFKQLAA